MFFYIIISINSLFKSIISNFSNNIKVLNISIYLKNNKYNINRNTIKVYAYKILIVFFIYKL